MDTTHRPQLPPIRSIPCLARHLPPPASPTPPAIPLPLSKPIEVLDLVDSDSETEDPTSATGSGRRSSTSSPSVVPSAVSRHSKNSAQRVSPPTQNLHAGCAAGRPCATCVKNGVSQASEDNANKRKKRSSASMTPKIRRPPLYRSPPPPVHRPYALPSRAYQQPYPTRSEMIDYDTRSSIERGNRPSFAILRRRSDQQACSTSLPTPPLSYFSSQSYA